jgi:hypothetical protein
MDLLNEQKLAAAFAPVIQDAIARLPEAVKEALDGLTITVTISRKEPAK